MPQVDADMQAAGIEALNAGRNDDESSDAETVSAVWADMIAAWCRKVREVNADWGAVAHSSSFDALTAGVDASTGRIEIEIADWKSE